MIYSFPSSCRFFLLFILVFVGGSSVYAQGILSGRIYDKEKAQALPFVQVWNVSTDQRKSADVDGRYGIAVRGGDTIVFSSLGFYSEKLVIDRALSFYSQNIFMKVRDNALEEVVVYGKKSYRADSLEKRDDYAEAYSYKDRSTGQVALMAVFTPLSFIEYLTDGSKRKQVRSFQSRLWTDEQERFVDNYYNPEMVAGVAKITDEEELMYFMRYSRPPYSFMKSAPKYDVQVWIFAHYKTFKEQQTSIQDSLNRF